MKGCPAYFSSQLKTNVVCFTQLSATRLSVRAFGRQNRLQITLKGLCTEGNYEDLLSHLLLSFQAYIFTFWLLFSCQLWSSSIHRRKYFSTKYYNLPLVHKPRLLSPSGSSWHILLFGCLFCT